jgi:hypothetical protein
MRIIPSSLSNLSHTKTLYFRDLGGDKGDVSRFISFTAMRMRRQKRAVGFQKQAV